LEEKKGLWEATYKAAKKLAERAFAIAKNNAYEWLYQKLETKEGAKEVFKLARVRERRTRDLGCIRCIKGEDGRMLVEETEIRERWWSYFSGLLNDKCDSSRRGERGV